MSNIIFVIMMVFLCICVNPTYAREQTLWISLVAGFAIALDLKRWLKD